MTTQRSEIARTTLAVLFIIALIAGSGWILRPFLGAFLWAATIVVATWPILIRLERRFGGRRGPAVAVMTIAMLAIFVVPVAVAVRALATRADDVAALASLLSGLQIPAAPAWIGELPVVGERIASGWNEIASAGPDQLVTRLEPYLRSLGTWFAQHAGTLASFFIHFLIMVVLAAVLYTGGEKWGEWLRRFARRLAGERGDRVAVLAAQAIRGVALGVVVTALLQTILGALGLAVTGVPFASVLTALMFMLCIAQLGPILVLLGATAWVYVHSGPVAGTLMLAWSLAVGLMDNFVRPVLIKRGADLPLLLIFVGVVGGMVSLGIIGIFVGPVVLAVTYTLLDDWTRSAAVEPASAGATTEGEGSP
jgi:predicted PurR-regulated permease PerM